MLWISKRLALEMEVISNPYDELPIRNDKYAALCTELHLGHRHITKLGSLYSKFINLSILWLNNNNLSEIRGLEENVRLKYLYLHDNRLQSVTNSSLSELKYLETLTLNNNQLMSLDEVLIELKYLKSLKSLDLFDNPISQEDNYRLLVISEMPWLHSLDRKTITKSEFKESKKLKLKLKKLNNLKLESPEAPSSSSASIIASESSHRRHLLQPLLERISQLFQLKRIFFKDICLQYDPRRLGLISTSDFKSCLIQFNILSQFSDQEYDTLLLQYTLPNSMSSTISTSTRRRGGVGETVMVNYELFCQDTLPIALQFTKKKLATTSLSNTQTRTTEKIPEISATVKDLICTVKKYQQEEKLREARVKRETILNVTSTSASTSSHTLTGTGTGFGTGTWTGTSVDQSQHPGLGGIVGLDPWLVGQLRSILTEIALKISTTAGGSGGGGGKKKLTLGALCQQMTPEIQLTETDVAEVLSRMRDLGKTIQNYSPPEALSQIMKNKQKISLKDISKIFQLDTSASHTTTAAPPTTPSKKKHFFQSLKVEWRDLSDEERRQQEEEEFSLARGYMDRILRGSDRNSASSTLAAAPVGNNKTAAASNANNNLEEEMRAKEKELFQLTFQKSINGTRMASTATSHSNRRSTHQGQGDEKEEALLPHRVIQTAPNRSDVIVIPSLNSASQRADQQKELKKNYNWEEHLSRLGLKKERLEIALRRKERSLTSEMGELSPSLSLPPAVGAVLTTNTSTSLTSSGVRRRKGEGGASTQMSQRESAPKHGWGNTTGTLVFK
jgi:hypothetical protein